MSRLQSKLNDKEQVMDSWTSINLYASNQTEDIKAKPNRKHEQNMKP